MRLSHMEIYHKHGYVWKINVYITLYPVAWVTGLRDMIVECVGNFRVKDILHIILNNTYIVEMYI